jgi:predicted nucleotidyltransferase
MRYRQDITTATSLLKNEGCTSVYLFGSLVTGKIHQNSDIDLGIKGLPAKKFIRTYSMLDNELSNKVDLVDFDSNSDFLLCSIHWGK